jgi:hypothetical protein
MPNRTRCRGKTKGGSDVDSVSPRLSQFTRRATDSERKRVHERRRQWARSKKLIARARASAKASARGRSIHESHEGDDVSTPDVTSPLAHALRRDSSLEAEINNVANDEYWWMRVAPPPPRQNSPDRWNPQSPTRWDQLSPSPVRRRRRVRATQHVKWQGK